MNCVKRFNCCSRISILYQRFMTLNGKLPSSQSISVVKTVMRIMALCTNPTASTQVQGPCGLIVNQALESCLCSIFVWDFLTKSVSEKKNVVSRRKNKTKNKQGFCEQKKTQTTIIIWIFLFWLPFFNTRFPKHPFPNMSKAHRIMIETVLINSTKSSSNSQVLGKLDQRLLAMIIQ